MHFSLLQLAHALSFPSRSSVDHGAHEGTVGVFESQRYLALESQRLSTMESPQLTADFMKLLSEACDGLLEQSQKGLEQVKLWLAGVREGKWESRGQAEKRREERLGCLVGAKNELDLEIKRFRAKTRYDIASEKIFKMNADVLYVMNRHRVLDPYRVAFDPKHSHDPHFGIGAPPHKYLFHCYTYEYHTLQLSMYISGSVRFRFFFCLLEDS